jgi:hypothetical protein
LFVDQSAISPNYSLFTASSIGIHLKGGSVTPQNITNSNITRNTVGIKVEGNNQTPSCIISDCNLIKNSTYNLEHTGTFADASAIIPAENNYWGTTVLTEIDALIYDHVDNSVMPTVDYLPIRPTINTAIVGTSDFDASGLVDGVDLTIMANTFGAITGDANFNDQCDLNASGRVDGFDLAIFATRFGASGLDKITAGLPPASLMLTADTDALSIGDRFRVMVNCTDMQPAAGIAFILSYDMASFELTDVSVPNSITDRPECIAMHADTGGDLIVGIASSASFEPTGDTPLMVVEFAVRDLRHDTAFFRLDEAGILNEYGMSRQDCVAGMLEMPTLSTGVADVAPMAFALAQNSPNPFNPVTTIALTLPEDMTGRLRVYNLSGQMIAELLNGHCAAGLQTVVWDGRNSQGEPVGSGVYVYRFTSRDYTSVRKMTLIR